MNAKHDIKTVQLFLGEIDNASLRGKHRRDLLLKARAAFDRLTLGADVTVQPAGLGVAALIPVGDLVHVGRGSMRMRCRREVLHLIPMPLLRSPHQVVLCASQHWPGWQYRAKDGRRIASTWDCERCEYKVSVHLQRPIKQGRPS